MFCYHLFPWIAIYPGCWIVLSTPYKTWPKSNINRQSTHHKSNLVFSEKRYAPLLFDGEILDIVQRVLKTSHDGVRELAQKLLNTVANFESSQRTIKS